MTVLKLSLASLRGHKRRLVGAVLGVFLGVSFLAGALALSDTLSANFDTLFRTVNAGTDVVVRSSTQLGAANERQPGLIPASLVQRVRGVPGVANAQPYVQGFGEIVGRDGKAIGRSGPPKLAASWVDDPNLNPYRIAQGRAPRSADEVVINRGAANTAGLAVGDTATILTPDPVRVHVVGIATFGSTDGFGLTTFVAFPLDGAERYITKHPGELTEIRVRATDGTSPDELLGRVRSVLPDGVEAITGSQLTQNNLNDLSSQFLNFVKAFLIVFAGIALLVATFSIHNTFGILTAQRARETGLLRAIGATRSQVLGASLVETLLVGAIASAAGVLGGIGVASLLKAVFAGFGFALPAGGLDVTASMVVIAFVTGVVATVVAGVAPSLRAARVSPMAALRETAIDCSAFSMPRRVAGGLLTVAGLASLVAVPLGGGGVLARAGLGALATVIGVVMLLPAVSRPVSSTLGRPVAAWRGVTGTLARQNAMRNPRTTAGTAAALMVGVAVVTLFTVFAASLKASIDDSVSRSLRADLVVDTGVYGGGGLSPALVAAVSGTPGVRVATGLGRGDLSISGQDQKVTVVDPAKLGAVLDLNVVRGSLTNFTPGAIAVSRSYADNNSLHQGALIPVTFPDGATTRLTVAAVYDAKDIVGDVVLPQSAWTPHATQAVDYAALVSLTPGTSVATAKAAVQTVADRFGGPTVRDRAGYTDAVTGGVTMALGLVYVMLALAIVIALMGIANTLSLSIHERTRELGLLRAVGATQSQVRSMIRWESVLIALLGTLAGTALGVLFGWALVQAASSSQVVSVFSAPATQIAPVVVAGAVAGLLAGIRPARRAARLDLLKAIATE